MSLLTFSWKNFFFICFPSKSASTVFWSKESHAFKRFKVSPKFYVLIFSWAIIYLITYYLLTFCCIFRNRLLFPEDNYFQIFIKLFGCSYFFIYKRFWFSLILRYSQHTRQAGIFSVNIPFQHPIVRQKHLSTNKTARLTKWKIWILDVVESQESQAPRMNFVSWKMFKERAIWPECIIFNFWRGVFA